MIVSCISRCDEFYLWVISFIGYDVTNQNLTVPTQVRIKFDIFAFIILSDEYCAKNIRWTSVCVCIGIICIALGLHVWCYFLICTNDVILLWLCIHERPSPSITKKSTECRITMFFYYFQTFDINTEVTQDLFRRRAPRGIRLLIGSALDSGLFRLYPQGKCINLTLLVCLFTRCKVSSTCWRTFSSLTLHIIVNSINNKQFSCSCHWKIEISDILDNGDVFLNSVHRPFLTFCSSPCH